MEIQRDGRRNPAALELNQPASFYAYPQLDAFHEATTHQERRGPAADSLADADLFFEDKV